MGLHSKDVDVCAMHWESVVMAIKTEVAVGTPISRGENSNFALFRERRGCEDQTVDLDHNSQQS